MKGTRGDECILVVFHYVWQKICCNHCRQQPAPVSFDRRVESSKSCVNALLRKERTILLASVLGRKPWERIAHFQEGRWATLLQHVTRPIGTNQPRDDTEDLKLSAARQALTASSLAPGTPQHLSRTTRPCQTTASTPAATRPPHSQLPPTRASDPLHTDLHHQLVPSQKRGSPRPFRPHRRNLTARPR